MSALPLILGIVAALPDEARCLNAPRARRRQRDRGAPIARDETVRVGLSGIGPERAAASAAALLDEGAGALVSWGFAGALDPALQPGALVLPAQVRDTEGHEQAADAAWLDRLRGALVPSLIVSSRPLLSSSTILRDPFERQRLWGASGAVAVDMESAAIAAAANHAGVPFVAIRAICDGASERLPATAVAAIGADGRLRPLHGLASLACRPWEVPALARLTIGRQRAALSLRTLARLAGTRLRAPA